MSIPHGSVYAIDATVKNKKKGTEKMKDVLTEREKTLILNTIRNPLLTNCYLFGHEVIEMIRTHEIHCFCYEDIVVLIHPSDGFHKMYYFLKKPDILVPNLVAKIREDIKIYQNLVGTVVTRMPDKNVGVLEMLKFRPYKEYKRKQIPARTIKMDWCKTPQVTKTANTADLEDIYQLLHGTFDVMSDHLVSRQELSTFLESSQVLKVHIEGELAGVLLFETFGKKSYLRLICVNDGYRRRSIGSSLLKSYLEQNRKRVKLFYLWVESKNKEALRLYEGFGYKDDGLMEYIYLY